MTWEMVYGIIGRPFPTIKDSPERITVVDPFRLTSYEGINGMDQGTQANYGAKLAAVPAMWAICVYRSKQLLVI